MGSGLPHRLLTVYRPTWRRRRRRRRRSRRQRLAQRGAQRRTAAARGFDVCDNACVRASGRSRRDARAANERGSPTCQARPSPRGAPFPARSMPYVPRLTWIGGGGLEAGGGGGQPPDKSASSEPPSGRLQGPLRGAGDAAHALTHQKNRRWRVCLRRDTAARSLPWSLNDRHSARRYGMVVSSWKGQAAHRHPCCARPADVRPHLGPHPTEPRAARSPRGR